MIDGRKFYDQLLKNDTKNMKMLEKLLLVSQGDYYTTASLLDYPYFKENYRLILIDLSKQQAVDAN